MNDNNIEIERKFFVRTLPDGLEDCVKHHMIQAYISTNPTIRIRKSDDEYYFTFKGAGFVKKTEFEHPLTKEQFYSLLGKKEGNIIEKTRYIIPLDNELRAELDIYEGSLAGFMNVEVEFPDMKSAGEFVPPVWFGDDISLDRRFSNASLSKYGLPESF